MEVVIARQLPLQFLVALIRVISAIALFASGRALKWCMLKNQTLKSPAHQSTTAAISLIPILRSTIFVIPAGYTRFIKQDHYLA